MVGRDSIERASRSVIAVALLCFLGCRHPPTADPRPEWPEREPLFRWVRSFPEPDLEAEPSAFTAALDFLLGLEPTRNAPPVFQAPLGLAVSSEGRLWVTEPDGRRVLSVDLSAQEVTPIECAGRPWGRPTGLAVDGRGGLLVADASASEIVRVDPTGSCTSFGRGTLSHPVALAVTSSLTFVADPARHAIFVFDRAGEVRALQTGMEAPVSIAVSMGTLLAVDLLGYRLLRYSFDGLLIGELQEPPEAIRPLGRPKAVAAGPGGRTYVADGEQSDVLVFDRRGELETWFAGAGMARGGFVAPASIAASATHVYVLDGFRGKIEVYEVLRGPR